ncbi:hypothetical protein CBS101457_004305 [Exobasidium rhododendri]|nr:hypothetical protein CBS101457_004305 [Exobasidium rhododendri]
MPPKLDTSDPEVKRLLEQFASIGFAGQKAEETVRNAKKSEVLSRLIERNQLAEKKLDAALIVAAASNPPKDLSLEQRSYVVERIADGSLNNTDRVSEACKYVGSIEDPGKVDKSAFDAACGVGVSVSALDVQRAVSSYMKINSASIDEQRWSALSSIMVAMRSDPALRWANPLDIKNAVEKSLETLYGPKSQQAPPAKAAKDPKAPVKKTEATQAEVDPNAMFRDGFLSKLHKPGENAQCRPSLKEEHLRATRGRVVTRFPPEPNGFLHIGHSKAIAVDFGYARYHGGECILRYDDTNPEAEEEKYFESILEMVRWLGFEPTRITYSSDYFQKLYDLAVELIKKGKAYVDHSTGEEINAGRGGKDRGPRKANKYSLRPVEESLREFEEMKNGKYKPGTVTLRMKQDLEGNGNPQMWDLIAYRVLDAKHHRTGSDWCIYPTYDFTHCLVDSFENISHSLCTTEFVLSRESYEWLCDALDVYKPRQYEFGRLNLEGTVTSKRKILKLVKDGHVKDWDDPRLFTLLALRRRGIPPGAILSFINQLGVTTTVSTIQSKRLDQSVRQYLENSTPRLMMCLDPVKVILDNVPDDFYMELERPLHPKIPAFGTSKVPFTKVVYIDQSDFRALEEKDYFRLAPGKTVGLLSAPFQITCTSFVKDESTNRVKEIHCQYEDEQYGGNSKNKGKAYIQWVAEHQASQSPVAIDEVRMFRPLFTSLNPAGEDNYLDHIDTHSLEVNKNAIVEIGIWKVAETSLREAKRESEERANSGKEVSSNDSAGAPARSSKSLFGNEVVRFQAMRIAYFCLDNRDVDLDAGKLVFNRIVSLKEDSAKN